MTDEVAKRNYEKYGNPDGPQTTKVGIGLPRFLLEKENHLMILCIFFFVLLFVVPMTFICYYQRTKSYAANGVMIETLQFLGYYINESTRVKNCPELIAASAESREMLSRPTDNAEMKPVSQHVTEHKKRQFQLPIIIRNSFLIWAHMQRLHNYMSEALRQDCDQLLKYSMKITQAMIEIACMREWFFTAQAMIEFRRSLVQALDIKASQLLQIPHFSEEHLKHCHRGKNAVSSLSEFLNKDAESRKGLAKMEPSQIADIEEFCAHVSDVELKAFIEVEDEGEVVVGDVATVTCQLKRRNLKENEAMGPVHAPLFPEPKFEEWWLFLVETTPTTRIMTFERIRDTSHFVEEKLRFQVSRPGKHSLVLHALCDSYAGLDQKVDLNFTASTEEEVKREVFVHPEDEDLDLQPTLFQQFMGELNHEEESEEEEEEEGGKRKKADSKPKARDLGAKVAEAKADSDDDDDDDDDDSDDEPAPKAKAKAKVKAAPKPADDDDDDDDDEDDEEDEPPAKKAKVEEAPKKKLEVDENKDLTAFVGGIAFSCCTEETLKKDFGECGEIVKLNILMNEEGRPKGIAFITFKTQEGLDAALKFDGEDYGGRFLKVNVAGQGGGKGGKDGKGKKGKDGKGEGKGKGKGNNELTVFIRGLSFDLTEDVLRKDFEECGKIVSLRLPKNEEGRPKGIAFIEYENKEGLEAALKFDGDEYSGRTINVAKAGDGPAKGDKKGGKDGKKGKDKGKGKGKGKKGGLSTEKKAAKDGAMVESTGEKKTFEDSDDE
mmetsp:Transcript_153301/g.270534  ORF Transcript_153301/g.270534 Transcript_153301/m.270534 type:complete len:775 (-) Transcript_153301:90-2414(-)